MSVRSQFRRLANDTPQSTAAGIDAVSGRTRGDVGRPRKLGPSLVSLPDGEIGERSDAYPVGDRAAWVGFIMDRCERDTTAWKALRSVTILFPDGVVPRSDGRQETLQIDGYVSWSVSTGQVS